ncbi:hypothetical protein HaLaN_27700, partial [Haematococcus lacustris]
MCVHEQWPTGQWPTGVRKEKSGWQAGKVSAPVGECPCSRPCMPCSAQAAVPQQQLTLAPELRMTVRLLASGALILVFEAMPAQAIADTFQLLTINCICGGVGGPSLGKLTRDIAARCENVRFSLAGHTEKGTPLHKPACCEPTT